MSYSRLVLANLLRNKLRTAFTAGAITLAVMLVCFLLTMPAALDGVLDSVANDARISVHHKAGLVYQMPASFTRKVRAVDGVAGAMGILWYGGAFEETGKVTFPSFAVEAEHVGAVYPDYGIPADQLEDFVKYRDGALVGRMTADEYGWEIGDRVALKSTAWPVDLDFRIVGIIENTQTPNFWFNREYLEQALESLWGQSLGQVGTIWVRASDPSMVGSIMQTVDEMSRNSEAETASETEKSFYSNFFGSLQGFIQIILLVTGLVTLCIIFIAANTASMNVRERSGEIAVLKAIGFRRKAIFSALLGEAVIISTLAGLAGLVLAIGFTTAIRSVTASGSTLGPLGGFVLTGPVIVQGLFLSLFIGMLAGIVPSFGAARKPVATALHEIF